MTSAKAGAGMVALLLGTLAGPPLSAQFAMQDSGTAADLRGIVNVGNGTAWASGTHGTVLRTEDAGFLWQGCATPPGAEQLDFRGIQAFDDQTAIVMSSGKGDLSHVYKTTDGCKSWKLVFTNPDKEGFFDAIRKVTPQHFFLLGDPIDGGFVIFESENGGEAWRRLQAAGLADDPEMQGAFAASNSSLVASGRAHTFFASGGKNGAFLYQRQISFTVQGEGSATATQSSSDRWTRVPIPMGTEKASSAGVFSLAEEPRTGRIVAVGGDYTKANAAEQTAAFFSPEIGAWSRSASMPHGYRSSVAYDPTTKTWITVGPNGTDISTDDGHNWRPLLPGKLDEADADKRWNALSLPYVVGPHGRIGRLRDDALPGRK